MKGAMRMYRFALLGGRLPHSLSPQIHRRLLGLSGQEGEYTLMETGDQPPDQWVPQLLKLDGFNVTIPHKESVIPFLKGLDPTAEAIGAVNTVYQGIGYNTDLLGFTSALETLGQPLAGQRVCILGAGGTARMMAAAALSAGCSVRLGVRESSKERAEALCSSLLHLALRGAEASVCPIGSLAGGYDLLCNATPEGMFPHPEGCPVTPAALAGVKGVFDAVYNPTPTRLARLAEQNGIPALCGMSMLVGQAAAAQTIWTGACFDRKQLEQVAREMEGLLA